MIALAQAEGKLCAWIDSEMSYSEDWARTLGVDPEKLIYSQARTISDMVDVGVGPMNAGVDLIVVDSITSMLPAQAVSQSMISSFFRMVSVPHRRKAMA